MFKDGFTMPGLGNGLTFILTVLVFVGGAIVGINTPMWLQMILVIAMVVLISSPAVSRLGIGSISYLIIYVALVLGFIVGDISSIVQTGGEAESTVNFFNLFKVG